MRRFSMKFIRPGILVIMVLFALISCKKDPIVISISDKELLLENVAGTTTLEIVCSGNWSASISSLWCSIYPLSGSGNGTITITPQDNTEGAKREVYIYISAGDTKEIVKVRQGYMYVESDEKYYLFDDTGGSEQLKITSNASWTVNIADEDSWLVADKLSGTGDTDILITVPANSGTTRRVAKVEILYDSDNKLIIPVYQQIAGEPFISAATLSSPLDGATDENRVPIFRWEHPEFSLSPEEIKYYFEISEDLSGDGNWEPQPEPTAYSMHYLEESLESDKTYYWRVVAEDINGGRSVSEVFSFTTGSTVAYLDGEYAEELSSSIAKPSEIIFMGDGYTPDDFRIGGKFDSDVAEGIAYLFDVEPFKTYKEYFRIYKVAAYSRESGASVGNIEKDTKFKARFEFEGDVFTSAEVDTALVREYAMNIPGMSRTKLNNVLIVVISNIDRYAGTTYVNLDGSTIAVVPVSRQSIPGTDYASIMIHEAGGHGFGRLADEYVNYYGTISSKVRERITSFTQAGYYANIDLTGLSADVKWKHFIGKPGYERVATYEGAYYYATGVWRPEETSCMIDHSLHYFNAPSREAIVKRILNTADVKYDLDEFIAKDVEKEP